MEVEYRSIRPDERDALLDLYHHLNADDPPVPSEEGEAAWQAILSDPKLQCLVAAAGDRLIASCILAVIPNLTRGAHPYALIENVVTHADWRRRGVGRTLLQHALDLAWRAGCYKAMLLTGRKDEATLRFYERSGFLAGKKTGFIAYPD